jgi:seryl-tRNA synthetase
MKDETGKVVFDEDEQKEVDRIVGERLSREGIHDMKEIMEHLKPFGYEGTPAQIKAAIKADAEQFVDQLKEIEKQQALEQLQQQAKDTGTTPELLATIKALQDDMSAIKNKSKAAEDAVNQRIASEKMFDEQVKYFGECEDTKDIDITKLNENPKFVRFLSKQRPTGKKDFLVEVYKDFVELVGGAEVEAAAKIQANIDRSTSSGRGTSSDGAGSLTADEKAFVDDHNRRYPHMKMTYKEFSERKRK